MILFIFYFKSKIFAYVSWATGSFKAVMLKILWDFGQWMTEHCTYGDSGKRPSPHSPWAKAPWAPQDAWKAQHHMQPVALPAFKYTVEICLNKQAIYKYININVCVCWGHKHSIMYLLTDFFFTCWTKGKNFWKIRNLI